MKIRSMESSFVWLHRIMDFLIPPFMLYIITLSYELEWVSRYQYAAILSSLLVISINQFNGLYHSWRGRSLFQGSLILIKSWLLTLTLLIMLAFILKVSEQYSRLVLSIWFLTTPALFIIYRITLRKILASLYKKGLFTKKAAIYGTGSCSEQLKKIFQRNTWLGYRIIGFFDDSPEDDVSNKIIGGTNELLKLAKSGAIQTVYIALQLDRGNEIKQLLNTLSDTTVTVKYIPDFFSFDLLHASMTTIGGMPVINIFDTPLNGPAKAFIKRLEDILFTSLILFLISPVLLLISLGIKISSPGPIIFKQKRYGLNGKDITIYKFRSMTTQDNGKVIKQAKKNDARITKLGAFLRKTSLDELPQFINVLQGNMSIVGPRPHAVAHNEEYRKLIPAYMQRHLVKPGITGWAQINGWRGETDTLEKMEKRVGFDLYYINHWSLWMDFKIIILTIFKGFINKNAY